MASSLIDELKRRRVFRALIGYAVVAFAVLQIIEPVMHGLKWPDAVLGYVVVGVAIGFPIVVVLAWIFDVGASGIERTSVAAAPSLRGPRMAATLVAIGALAAAPGLAWYFLRHRAGSAGARVAAVVPQPDDGQEKPASPDVRWVVPVGDSPSYGPPDAPVTLVEFADFQCPYSKMAEAHVRTVLERYPNKVRVVWKDYPMGAHVEADGAAHLAREALRQQGVDGFWKAHRKLFELSPRLDGARLLQLAGELGLDVAQAKAALASERHRAALDADVDLLARLGQASIPTFFVNGRNVTGNTPRLVDLVGEELAEARRRIAAGVPAAKLYEDVQRIARTDGATRRRVIVPDPGDRPARGGPAGKALAVHHFCELSSPICAWIDPPLRKTIDSYGDEVRLVWWDVHDPKQPVAVRTSLTAQSVAPVPQGFWKLHDALLGKQRIEGFGTPPPDLLSLPSLREHAAAAGADLSLFDYLVSTRNNSATDERDTADVRALGRTPGDVVIDGELYGGFDPPRVWRVAIDRALARRK